MMANYGRYCSLTDDETWRADINIRYCSLLLNRDNQFSLGFYSTKEKATAAVKRYFDLQDKRQIVTGDYVMLWNRMEIDYRNAQDLRYEAEVEMKLMEKKAKHTEEMSTLQQQHVGEMEKLRQTHEKEMNLLNSKHTKETESLNKKITALEHAVKFAKWGSQH